MTDNGEEGAQMNEQSETVGEENIGNERERRQRTRRIGRHLKTLYDEVAKEEVPDEFLALLEKAASGRSDRATADTDISDEQTAATTQTPYESAEESRSYREGAE